MGMREFLQSGYNLLNVPVGSSTVPRAPNIKGTSWTGVQKFISKKKALFFNKTGTAMGSAQMFERGLASPYFPLAVSSKLARPGTVERTIEAFSRGSLPRALAGGPLKGVPFMRFAVPAGLWALAAGVYGVGNQLTKTLKFRPIERPSSLRSGSGYISWSKKQGMPANHLSTDGLSLAMSNMRHTSTI